jgi:uncharacterized protein YbcI
MGIKDSDTDNVLTLPRRGRTEGLIEERRRRTAHCDSRQGIDFRSRPPLDVARKAALSESAAKTRGEIEAGICIKINRFEQEYLGRGPQEIHAHLIGDLLVVRLTGVLTLAEQQLTSARDAEKGRDLVKQVRTHLIETARPVIAAMIEQVTSVRVISLHHDLSTVTGEEVMLFTLATTPGCREATKKGN